MLEEPENFSTNYEPNVNYNTHEHYVAISSGSRDTVKYPLHYNYRVDFQIPFRNVKHVEIVSCVIPDADILNEPVVIFDIEELNFMSFLCSNGYKRIFAAFPVSEPNAQNHTFINLKAQGPRVTYRTPIATLSSLTVKLFDVDYQHLTFGSPGGSTSKSLQHSFLLKITVVESSLNALEFRKLRRDN